MKHQQICPHCGNKLENNKINTLDFVITCNICNKNAVFTDEKRFLKIINKLVILLVAILLLVFSKYGIEINGREDSLWIIIPVLLFLTITTKCIDLFKKKPIQQVQCYDNYDDNDIIITRKPLFSAQTSLHPSIPAKQRKKEFVKDNILQISANGESEYIILTKADFETGKCEATFPVLKKENGLALLEKYSEFEISNGEEVLGTLKIEKVFEA